MKDRVGKAGVAVWSWVRRHWPVLTLASVTVVIVIGNGLTMWFWPAPWDWMKGAWDWMKGAEASNGAALRNLALVAAAGFGLLLAFWRSCVAHKQANSQSKQADTAERGHNNERYQKGADMLGSGVMTTRMGGVYALERLAQEHPYEYHAQIMKLLCAFLREQSRDGGEEAEVESRVVLWDLGAALEAFGKCRWRLAERGRLKDIEGDFKPNLADANISPAYFVRANISHTYLGGANLSGANLRRADLSGSDLSLASLSGADLSLASLSGADLSLARITGADFDQVEGLSQEQLDTACQDPDGSPPMHLPDGLTWDEEAAKERWRETY